uniref:Uncharacterized protein n=1 Tax=Timema tahoe TaxID=61484 RepID=A0A7R9IE88_9NEOP|nr:unnamed protein product [Timema tahoe]
MTAGASEYKMPCCNLSRFLAQQDCITYSISNNRGGYRRLDAVSASYKFLNCVYAAGTQKCSKEGALFLRRMAVTLSNVKVYYNTLCRGTKDGTSAPEVCDGSAQVSPSFKSSLIILMMGAGFLQGRV